MHKTSHASTIEQGGYLNDPTKVQILALLRTDNVTFDDMYIELLSVAPDEVDEVEAYLVRNGMDKQGLAIFKTAWNHRRRAKLPEIVDCRANNCKSHIFFSIFFTRCW